MLLSILVRLLDFRIYMHEGAHEHTGFWYICEDSTFPLCSGTTLLEIAVYQNSVICS